MGASSRIAIGLLIGCSCPLLACASGDDTTGAPMYEDSGEHQPPTPPCDPNLPDFTVGMNGLKATDSTGQFSVRIEDAPKPPQRDYNTWKIAVEDASGQPMANAKLGWACAWMAVHMHGSNPQVITNLGGGKFELEKQNLSMFGPWEVRFWVDSTGAGPEYLPQSGGTKVALGNECMPTNGVTPSANIKFDICVPQSGGMK
jgi:hypothetical protein